MAGTAFFANFDDKAVYDQSLAQVLDESTRNFVVEFGKEEAKIAFDLVVQDIEGLLQSGVPPERSVRWMYVFSPVLSRREARSNRLLLIEIYGLRVGRPTSLSYSESTTSSLLDFVP